MDKSILKTCLLSVRHYLSDRLYYYQKVKNYAKVADILVAVKPLGGARNKLGTYYLPASIFNASYLYSIHKFH